jgi:GTP-binding protein
LKLNDVATMKDLDNAAVPYQIVLTKGDKVKPPARPALIEATVAALKKHPAAHPHVLLTSAETAEGIPELRAALATLAAPPV